MQPVALVTDSTAGIAPAAATELGLGVVPCSAAIGDAREPDFGPAAHDFYHQMANSSQPPRTFAPAEAAFRAAFESGLESSDSVLCLLAPFDVSPAFTTATAAALAIEYDRPGARIKVVNPGVGSAGLGALLLALAPLAPKLPLTALLELVDELAPRCDALFVPGTPEWLERGGRLALIEDRLGPLAGGIPVVRVGSRLTGVELLAAGADPAPERVAAASRRPGHAEAVNAVILHADAPELASRVEGALRARHQVTRLLVSELTPTHGSQLGPGTVGLGLCPAQEGP